MKSPKSNNNGCASICSLIQKKNHKDNKRLCGLRFGHIV